MRTASLASGSKGNCVFVECGNTTLLVDCGLNMLQLEQRLDALNAKIDQIDGILLTHEHIDHIAGVASFLKKNKNAKVFVPAFVKQLNIKSIANLPSEQIEWFSKSTFFVKDIVVNSFVLPHDSKFCVGYSLFFAGKKVSYATDLGFVSQQTLDALCGSDVLFFESNHDENLLMHNPKYPPHLKKRIFGTKGHLSNVACANALVYLAQNGVKQVVLSHLSEENNTPMLAFSCAKKVLGAHGIEEGVNICVDVAYQQKVGTIFNF